MALFYLQKTQVFPMVFVPIRQAGEPAKKRELLKVLEKVAMWQARETRPCRVEPAVGGEIGSTETWGNETKEIGWKMDAKWKPSQENVAEMVIVDLKKRMMVMM